MNKNSGYRRHFAWTLVCLATLSLSACHGGEDTHGTVDSAAQGAETEWFSNRDLKSDYDEKSCVNVALERDTAECDEQTVEISGGTVTITREGSYLLSGILEQGMVVIDTDDESKVQLILDGAEITNEDGAAIYVKSADKVFLTLAAGSVNVLANGGSYAAHDEEKVDGAIYTECNLTVNGTGRLEVMAAEGHGMVSRDDLRITEATLRVTSARHGLSGKDSVRMAGGSLEVVSGQDGIHSEHKDGQKGFVYIADGIVDVEAGGDGISASGFIQIDNGSFTIRAGGGSDAECSREAKASGKAEASQEAEAGREAEASGEAEASREAEASGEAEASQEAEASGEAESSSREAGEDGKESGSAKGIKASRMLLVNEGTFDIEAREDALHSDEDVTLRGGTYRISTNKVGVHGDGTVAIEGGSLEVSASHEGVEGHNVEISGGTLSLCATDDGINAMGSLEESESGGEEPSILISGGEIHIDAYGDGIDSNGSLTVTGGRVFVSGPVDNLNGALDYDGTARITGGILVAAGSSGMAMNFGEASTQGTILVHLSHQEAGTEIVLRDSKGGELVAYAPPKGFSSVVVSCPELVKEGVYTISAGDSHTEVALKELRYGKSFNE